MSANITLNTQLDSLMEELTIQFEKNGANHIESDADWPSPCEYQQNGKTFWKPYRLETTNDFDNIESGLDITLDTQIKAYFGRYYSDNIQVVHPRGELTLLQAWSEQDFRRLQQNIVGHLIMKSKLNQSVTIFFALTDQDDLNIVVDNSSGEVWLEYVGKEPHEKLAESLTEFMQQIKLAG